MTHINAKITSKTGKPQKSNLGDFNGRTGSELECVVDPEGNRHIFDIYPSPITSNRNSSDQVANKDVKGLVHLC